MLLDKLVYLNERAGVYATENGMDKPHKGRRTKKQWRAYTSFDYSFNSWGFRGPEYKNLEGSKVNICLGDSFTVNIGAAIEHSWCSQLAQHFDIPTLNLGMDGAGNDAIELVYHKACDVFDVQNTFVMYSFLHRRLVDGKFVHHVNTIDDETNFEYFKNRRIKNAIECAIPAWCHSGSDKEYLRKQEVYFFDIPLTYENWPHATDCVCEKSYKALSGQDWPTFEQFTQLKVDHADMYNEQYGSFMTNDVYKVYQNRDGFHMNYKANQVYSNYLYNQWKQRNES